MLKRRTFLKALGGSAAFGGALSATAASRQRHRVGKGGTIKKLMVLFLRGGNDGLNTMIPVESTEYNHYRNLRPDVGLNDNLLVDVPGSSGFFALHPSLSPLVPYIQAGHASLIHAVAYPNSDRSHFESQAYWETGVPGMGSLDGWLNRYLSNTTGPGLIRGVSIGSNIPQSVSGTVPVPVSNNFGTSTIDVDPDLNSSDSDAFRQKLRDTYALSATPGNADIYNTGNRIFDMIDAFADRDFGSYMPENGAVYPDSSLGRRVAHGAQMLKDDPSFLGVEIVTTDTGGYDTHANQLQAANPTNPNQGHARLLRQLAQSMAAFYQDMGDIRMQDTAFMVISEFGRRAYQNDSFGTDHGIGGLALVMSGSSTVNGNLVNGDGDWPGLAPGDLDGGNLDWVTDFRDIYWDILAGHMGLDNTTLNTILPGHIHTPVGM